MGQLLQPNLMQSNYQDSQLGRMHSSGVLQAYQQVLQWSNSTDSKWLGQVVHLPYLWGIYLRGAPDWIKS